MRFLHIAARRSEIFGLRLEDIDCGGEQIRLWIRKREGGTMEFGWIPMAATLAQALLSHLNQNKTADLVFPNPENGQAYSDRKLWMKGLCRRAGVKPFGIHAIRHLSASILAKEGMPLPLIQAVLRQRKLTTTQGYCHDLGLKDERRRIMDRKAKKNLKSIYVKFTSTGKPRKNNFELITKTA